MLRGMIRIVPGLTAQCRTWGQRSMSSGIVNLIRDEKSGKIFLCSLFHISKHFIATNSCQFANNSVCDIVMKYYYLYTLLIGVAVMEMNRPPVNSLSLDMLTEMHIAIEKLENDKTCRGVILSTVRLCDDVLYKI